MPSILGAQGQQPTVRRAVAFLTNVHVLLRHERNRSWPARIRTDDDQVRPNLGVAVLCRTTRHIRPSEELCSHLPPPGGRATSARASGSRARNILHDTF